MLGRYSSFAFSEPFKSGFEGFDEPLEGFRLPVEEEEEEQEQEEQQQQGCTSVVVIVVL